MSTYPPEFISRFAAILERITGDYVRVVRTPFKWEVQRWTGSRWVEA
jgi:hypothetical protein